MSIYVFGDLLKRLRKQRHISQSDMCRGLCNVAMASRIERDERVPSRKLIEALFSRLGEVPPYSKIPVTKADFIMRNLEYDIISSVANGNYEIKMLLDAYKTRKNTMTPLEQQFYEFYYAIYIDRDSAHPQESLSMLVAALKISISDFVPYSFPKQRLLSKTEIGILNSIAHRLYYGFGKRSEALQFMRQLAAYIELNNVTTHDAVAMYKLILFNLSNWLEDAGEIDEALQCAEKGINICRQYGKLDDFPYLLFLKGVCLAHQEKMDEAKRYLRQAFAFFDAIGRHEDSALGAKSVNEQFDFSFPCE